MNRRDFIKTVGCSGMAFVAPMTLSTKTNASNLAPVGHYFVFAHLEGGWDPTSFCDPKGNALRSTIDIDARNSGSSVNQFPASAIRSAADIYSGTATISAEMKYAPYLGTFNSTDGNGDVDDGAANNGITMAHVRRILAGTTSGVAPDMVLTASAADVAWSSANKSTAAANAAALLNGEIATVALNGIQNDLVDRDLTVNLSAATMPAELFVYDAFFCLHADFMRVVNGIDNRTISHSTGTMYADTGSLSMGYPDFSALYAATQGAERPLAWMSDGGGHSEAAGLVARSQASEAEKFGIVADPTAGMTATFSTHLEKAQALREDLQAEKETLPLRQVYQDQLYLVRRQGVEFASTAAELANPTTAETIALKDDATSSRREHMRIGAAGFESGMASSMHVSFGGFDTHNNHDSIHFGKISDVLIDLHFLLRSLETYGVKEQTTLVIGSDFGRTPWYNDGDGKDHWVVSSYLLMGKSVAKGTAVNVTNGLLEASDVDATTMAKVDSGGVRMTAAHLHKQLRGVAGIANDPLSLQFPIDAEDVAIFG